MRRPLLMLVVALAALTLAGAATASAPVRTSVTGPFAAGTLTDFRDDAPAGTVFTDVAIFGFDQLARQNGGKKPAASPMVSVVIFRYTDDEVISLSSGDWPATVTFGKQYETATVTARGVLLSCEDVGPVPCTPPAPFDLDATYTAVGPQTKSVNNLHFLTEGRSLGFHFVQRGRPATVAASIDGAPVGGITIDGFIGTTHDGEICRGLGC